MRCGRIFIAGLGITRVSNKDNPQQEEELIRMGTITETVDVDVDLATAYNQWTQFETFPEFMEGIEEVQQITDTTLHWVAKVGPAVREFDAQITEQSPDESIAWHSTNGPDFNGRVSFTELDNMRTRVTAEMTIDPDGFVETVGDKSGAIAMRVANDMKRFKDFIESRGGDETGAWRGTVDGGTVDGGTVGDGTVADGTVADGTYGDETYGDALPNRGMADRGTPDQSSVRSLDDPTASPLDTSFDSEVEPSRGTHVRGLE